ncbi:MAG: ankyrin repeat domain-containing protein [Bacteroidales bacterium]|nr:ankyrin repeat domain-containing protein [Bacteroidales bacterium]MCF8459022.1 ankyrin repeat domain-containing protein [Bacteroidales bacterium]
MKEFKELSLLLGFTFLLMFIFSCKNRPIPTSERSSSDSIPEITLDVPDSISSIIKPYICVDSLIKAVKQNDTQLIKILLTNGCDINAKYKVNNWREDSPFRMAIWFCDTAMLQYMLDHGADPNLQLNNQQTPTHSAAGAEKEKFNLLLKYGGNVNTYTNGNSSTPLISAIQRNRIENIRTMISHSVHLDPDSSNGYNSALSAAISCENYEAIDLLIENGVNINAKFHSGMANDCVFCCPDSISVLHILIWKYLYGSDKEKLMNLLHRLISLGANLNVNINNECTPLELASTSGLTDIMKTLFTNGASINNALWKVSQMSNSDAVELLLSWNADIEKKDNYFESTPLIACITCCGDGLGDGIKNNDRIKTIELLLSHGANKFTQDREGNCFMDYLLMGAGNVYEHFINTGLISWEDMKIDKYGDYQFQKIVKLKAELFLMPNKNSPVIVSINENDTVTVKDGGWVIHEEETDKNIHWKQVRNKDTSGFIIQDYLK